MSNAGVEVGRLKREEELSVICIEVVVVQGHEGYKSTERCGVHDEEQRTKNRALRNATTRKQHTYH